MTPSPAPFWETKMLKDMSPEEWEALCDGCARCCMLKLQDDDTEEVFYTNIVCDLLNQQSCQCTRYPQRHDLVPDCVELGPEQVDAFDWLPRTCAYRIIAEGGSLPWWHPLVSGSQETVHEAGISVRGRVIAKALVAEEEEQDMIIRWIET
ncbi:MAG TPA: YcgN family cysteine cluster protein [Gammaproteobacteria bacterium]|jgi:uncharacterized cysteine cluster protein YcgN (CxxCxxCC family)|nr:MAG: YcgN family cysteine cluster protein [Gammaproteobacteria bacterium TMED134]RZO70771.1 MAG: YcgN family cysteine cluster protein [OM182 bacterium]HAL41403.1 YcgN family cysteine cluster protein [Gammaproteobacteria bacterium]|tara:strand:- start:121 stop:573 length:453 start_codon:yes stop_codon:yes gene_type:complete